MPEYTLDQLGPMIDALTARVNAIDGQNLTNPTTGSVNQLQSQITSDGTDLQQVVLSFENTLNQFKTSINAAIAQLNTLLGVPPTTNQIP